MAYEALLGPAWVGCHCTGHLSPSLETDEQYEVQLLGGCFRVFQILVSGSGCDIEGFIIIITIVIIFFKDAHLV